MRYFLVVLILLCSLAAMPQTASTTKPKTVKSHALLACEAERDQLRTWSLEDAAKVDVANAQIKQLSEQNAHCKNNIRMPLLCWGCSTWKFMASR
jgi:hypothetical protein